MSRAANRLIKLFAAGAASRHLAVRSSPGCQWRPPAGATEPRTSRSWPGSGATRERTLPWAPR
jgi:hypothetical protein